MDAGTPTLMDHPLQAGLIVLALAAFIYAVFNALQAWGSSRGHPAFDALGVKKWVMGTAIVAYMPPAAMVYVKRYFAGFAVFMLSLVGLGLTIAFDPAQAP